MFKALTRHETLDRARQHEEVEPSKFEDQYEDALKELLKKKQEGKPIERPERPKPTNVVNLMDAFRQSAEASGASTASKPKADAPARRTAHEKTEYRDRHYGREGRWLTKSGVGATH